MKCLLALACALLFSNLASTQEVMVLKTSGKVIIGDTTQISTPGPYNLYVQNGVMTEKVKVAVKNLDDWRDHAFAETPAINTVRKSIADHSHLYNMPSGKQLVEEGYELQKMDANIVEQVEWLWQYMIKLSDENKLLKNELQMLRKEIEKKD